MILKSLFDAIMERRARRLVEHVRDWLPAAGPMLDLGSGTGHFADLLERERGFQVVTADVTDMHVVGPPPVLVGDGVSPFAEGTFSAALLVFILAYPSDPAGVLAEAARVTRGPMPATAPKPAPGRTTGGGGNWRTMPGVGRISARVSAIVGAAGGSGRNGATIGAGVTCGAMSDCSRASRGLMLARSVAGAI